MQKFFVGVLVVVAFLGSSARAEEDQCDPAVLIRSALPAFHDLVGMLTDPNVNSKAFMAGVGGGLPKEEVKRIEPQLRALYNDAWEAVDSAQEAAMESNFKRFISEATRAAGLIIQLLNLEKETKVKVEKKARQKKRYEEEKKGVELKG